LAGQNILTGLLVDGMVHDQVGISVVFPPAIGQQLFDGLWVGGEAAKVILRDSAVKQFAVRPDQTFDV
jgi:hypothetical protein